MEITPQDEQLLSWIEKTPGLREQLEALRQSVQAPGGPGRLGAMELSLLERMRQMGRVTLEKWVQDQEGLAHEGEKETSRSHSKKN